MSDYLYTHPYTGERAGEDLKDVEGIEHVELVLHRQDQRVSHQLLQSHRVLRDAITAKQRAAEAKANTTEEREACGEQASCTK